MHLRRLILAALAAVPAIAAGLLLWSAPALALNRHTFSYSFGAVGSEDGQLKAPKGIAVNDGTHDLYVVDSGNDRIERFTPAGTYIGQFNGDGTYEVEGKVEHGSAAPTGAFDNPTRIAVDDSGNPLDPSEEDVYVVDRGHNVIDKFSAAGAYLGQLTKSKKLPFQGLAGVAVDSTGGLWVAQEIHETESGFNGEGELISYSDSLVNEFLSSNPARERTGSAEGGLAVNSEGRVYTPNKGGGEPGVRAIQLFKDYEYEGRLETNGMTDVAVDTSDNEAYVSFPERVEAYGENGRHSNPLLQVFGEGDLTGGDGIAIDSSSHAVYVTDAVTDAIVVFGRVIVPDVVTGLEPVEEEQEGSVTLEGTVNPDGEPVTSCQFEYGTESSYGQIAPCAVLPGSGSSPVTVRAQVSGLAPLGTYHYRLVAGNANGTNAGSDHSFVAPVRPAVDGESAEAIVSNAATLRAEVNPGGADTAYRFEYGPTAAYGMSVPIPAGDAGAGVEDTGIYARAQDLSPDTEYHYRVVISSAADREVAGPDQQFTTQPAGSTFLLPDGRAWEMVTPPDKHGAGLYAVGYYEGAVIQAAAAGGAFTWAASAPIEADPAGGRVGETTQVFTKRSAPGVWESLDIATPHTEGASSLAVGHSSEYKLFSTDLSAALVEPAGHTPLPPLPEGSEKTIYIRDDANGGYEALVSAANVPPGTQFGGNEEIVGGAQLVAATPDLSHVVIESAVALTAGSKAEGGLYEWADGKLRLVDVLPNGTEASQAELGGQGADVRNAISDDGSRLVWQAGGHLYLRDVTSGVEGETVQVDAAQGRPEPAAASLVYQTASDDDSRIFFTSAAPLTADATAAGGAEDLYVFEIASAAGEPPAGKLTDLTVEGNPGEQADVQRGVIGASEDGSYVYFVANGVLGDAAERGAKDGTCTEGRASNQTCNLYVAHYDAATHKWDAPVLVATLSGADRPDWSGDQGGSPENLREMTARVSPDGRRLAFMSDRSLTGYANRDANSGAADEEVFLYDADSERLVCASCDPTGAQPVGMLVAEQPNEPLIDKGQNWGGQWLAASVPGWTSETLSIAQYQSRYLSDSGRLYFNSSDALVPADVNGREDVYEYEPAGVGSCQPPGYGQSASDVFSQAAGGCVGLLSSGLSPEESVFMDASETGGDVFFMTSSRLAPQDSDTSYDVYDAHECTSAAPCAPPAALVPPPCTTGDACKQAPTPQPAIFGAPSSETFSGAGNIVPPGSKPAVTPRSSTRAQKLAGALKACRKKPKRRRAKCTAQARKRYGAKSSRARRSASASAAGTASRGVGR
jgi:hypothetical protein